MKLNAFLAPVLAMLVLAELAPRCGQPERPPPTPPPPAEETAEPAPAEVEPASWNPQSVDLAALDRYAGFSRDGLLFAWSELNPGAGLPVMSFVSSTTSSIEKTVPLTGETARRQVAQELSDEGFPPPGKTPALPPEVQASVHDGQVHVRFGPAPATRPWLPNVTPTRAEVVAVSEDGSRAAVKITGVGGGEFGPPVEWRIVELFK